MGHARQRLETEIKLALASAAAGRRLLRDTGFSVDRRRVLEVNTVFDTPHGLLRRGRQVLRLRSAGGRHTIAFKNAPRNSRFKSREEIESLFSDPAAMRDILIHLGYSAVFRYEKYRTEYGRRNHAGLVTLDETPIGAFLEIEGTARSIGRLARELGYSPSDYITASYGALYLGHCDANRLRPGNMVFSGRK